jgi:GTP-binding protein
MATKPRRLIIIAAVQVRSVEFVGSFGHPGPLPDSPLPEVAFFGRSNVGKSSLINTLLGRRGIARISKTPGKTQNANFFRINDRFLLVDMPGYGYAKVSKADRERFVRIVEQYLGADDRVSALVQLVDARHDPTDSDVESVERMMRTGRPVCIAFTKSDKVSKSSLKGKITKALRQFNARPETGVVPFSSVTGAGKAELWAWIEARLAL